MQRRFDELQVRNRFEGIQGAPGVPIRRLGQAIQHVRVRRQAAAGR